CITVRRCGRWQQHFHGQARDVRREAAPAAEADGSGPGWDFLDREPGPEEAAVLAETVQKTLGGLNEQEQRVVVLSLQGSSVVEVRRLVGCSESKVYRVLRHVRRRLEQLRDAEEEETGVRPDEPGR